MSDSNSGIKKNRAGLRGKEASPAYCGVVLCTAQRHSGEWQPKLTYMLSPLMCRTIVMN